MWRFFPLVFIVALTPVSAAPNPCEEFHRDYKTATAKLGAALQRYADCLDNGDARESCSSQFSRLRAAHRLLEISTSNYARYCKIEGRSARRG